MLLPNLRCPFLNNHAVCREVPFDDCPSPDDSIIPNRCSPENQSIGTDPDIVTNRNRAVLNFIAATPPSA